MTTTFSSIESAKSYAAACAGANQDALVFEKVEGIMVGDIFDIFDEDIFAKSDGQQAFKFKNRKGEERQIVVVPCGDGWHCWFLLGNGLAMRF